MGQYFALVNLDKREFVIPWDIGGVAKLWEWCANHQAGVIPFLLRKSTDGGGGDISKDYETAGRWAENRIALVGDYDDSGLFDEILASQEGKSQNEWTDISPLLIDEYNDFIECEELMLKPRAW